MSVLRTEPAAAGPAAPLRPPSAPPARVSPPSTQFRAWLRATEGVGASTAPRAGMRGAGTEVGAIRATNGAAAGARAGAGAGAAAGAGAGAGVGAAAGAGAGAGVGAGAGAAAAAAAGAGAGASDAEERGVDEIGAPESLSDWPIAAYQLAGMHAPLGLSPASPVSPASPAAAGAAAASRAADLHALATAVVERAALWGDGERGVARLRLGARASRGLASATITLEHDGERVRLRIDGASDEAAEALRARLRGRGIDVEEG